MSSVRITVLSAVVMTAIACGGGGSSSIPTPSPAPTPAPAPPPVENAASVSIPVGAAALGDRAYVPDALDVSVGTTVTWLNTDSTAHTSTSDGEGWNSSIVAPGGQFSVKFQSAGRFAYHCSIHPGMVGAVVVH